MPTIMLLAIAHFLSPFLLKAGEKVAEKSVESLFASRHDLADRYRALFKTELISLGLNETSNEDDITKKLDAMPDIKVDIEKKIAANEGMLIELLEALRQSPHGDFSGVQINAEKIGQVIGHQSGTMNVTFENF